MPSPYTRLFEDVFQVNLDGPWADTQFLGDFPIFEALLYKLHDLMFARSQVGAHLSVHA